MVKTFLQLFFVKQQLLAYLCFTPLSYKIGLVKTFIRRGFKFVATVVYFTMKLTTLKDT